MQEVQHDFAACFAEQPAGIQKFREEYLKSTKTDVPVSVGLMNNCLQMAAEAVFQLGGKQPIESTFHGGVKVVSTALKVNDGGKVTNSITHEFPKGLNVTLEDSNTVAIKAITIAMHFTEGMLGTSGSTTVETMDGRKVRLSEGGRVTDKALPQIIRALAEGKTKV